jgi:hypothetical protein
MSSAAPQTVAGTFVMGRVSNEFTADQAAIAAQLACVCQVNRLKTCFGDLKRVKKIVYVKVLVLFQPDFIGHTAVIDACSAFLVNVFGDDVGKHARSSDGIVLSPFNVYFSLIIFFWFRVYLI